MRAGRLERRPPAGSRVAVTQHQQQQLRVRGLAAPPGRRAIIGILSVDGDISAERLRYAYRSVVGRHEALRTRYAVDDAGNAHGVVESDYESLIDIEHLDTRTAAAPVQAAEHIAEAGAAKPFNLSTGQVARCKVIRVAEHRSLLVLTLDHFIADAHSLDLLLREIVTFYDPDATYEQAAAKLGIPFQLSDYARWEADYMRDHSHVLLQEWSDFLGGAIDEIVLPTRAQRGSASPAAAYAQLPVPEQVRETIAAIAAAVPCTPFAVFVSGLAKAVSELAGSDEVTFLIPASGRAAQGSRTVVGNLANVLPVKISAAGAMSAVLRETRRKMTWLIEHQQLPMSRLLERLVPGNVAGPGDRAQIFLSYHQAMPDPSGRFQPWFIRSVPEKSMFDISFWMISEPSGKLSLDAVWKRDYFSREDIESIVHGAFSALTWHAASCIPST